MRIGIDARSLMRTKTGIGKYLLEILRALESMNDTHQYYLYSHKPFDVEFGPKFVKRIGHGSIGTIWLHTKLPFMLIKDRIEVFWGPQYAAPFLPQIPRVITVHDLVYHYYPETLPKAIVLHNKYGLPFYSKTAAKIIADSYSTKNDLVKVLGVPDNKIEVVHLGVDPRYHDKKAGTNALKKFNLTPGYILYVGTIEPRKGIDKIIEAYSKIVDKVPNQLVIAGGKGWKFEGIFDRVKELGLEEKVRFTYQLSEQELVEIYQHAGVFVYPSLYEGFGLPPLEAMASGVPVITSNSSSLPEVVGDAGIMVDPGNISDLCEAILAVLANPDTRNTMIKKGLEQASKFSWITTAQETLRVLESCKK